MINNGKLPLAAILGGVLLFLSLFAFKLGLDNDSGWGKSRILLAIFGMVLIIFDRLGTRLKISLEKLTDRLAPFNQAVKRKLFVSFFFVISAGIYFLYALPAFHNPDFDFDYYGRMAAAFRHGQVHLLEKPPQSLLSLRDPYDYVLRYETGVVDEIPIDVSLYNGKYYLYWGPAPSLFLIFFSDNLIASIKDKFIGYFFACGILLYSSLFIQRLWRQYGSALPAWFIGIFVLTMNSSIPTLWMLKTSGIYEAAIFGGQFFIVGGFYWLYLALDGQNISHGKLFFGGIHWAFAMGTRLTGWPLILLGAGVTVLYLLRINLSASFKKALTTTASFTLPLLFALFLLGWYNYARFDTVTEFGLRYQLANTDYKKFTKPFDPFYIRGNLHNYFTYPIVILEKFPFIKPTENVASNERLAGLLYSSPWILFSIIPFARIAAMIFKRKSGMALSPIEVWFLLSVGGGSALMFFLVLLFYFPATRYIEDFMPLYFLFTFFLLAKEYKNGKGIFQIVYLCWFTALGLWSVIASMLLSMPVEYIVKTIRLLNQIRNWLTGLGARV